MSEYKTNKGLHIYHHSNKSNFEIGIDEAGRGPMFGRVYTAAVILPKDIESFNHDNLRDSKKFTSTKKITELSNYIKENAIAWSIQYEDEKSIDTINIRQATLKSMHHCITDILSKLTAHENSYQLLVDGNDFKPYMHFERGSTQYIQIPHLCVEGGDNTYTCIAAASILAKVARDEYIIELCEEYPDLKERYSIHTNKGYGTKKHMDGIKEHGITQWHRQSYGICKTTQLNKVLKEEKIE
jgi:ribonuclease HII